MNRELRLYLLAVGLPALALAVAGVRLVHVEMHRAARESAAHRMESQPRAPEEAAGRRGKRGGMHGDVGRANAQRHGRGPHMVRIFEEEDELAAERVAWIGGCVVGLLFLSLVSGGWLLFESVRTAREDAMRKTDFLSNVSHEFKTPLTTICLCAELAQGEGLDPARRRKALASIVSEAERLKSLVLSALDFSRLERRRRVFRVERADIAALVREAAEPMRELFAAKGMSLPEGGSPVEAEVDAAAFKQIVVILLDNAAKYAASDGPVEVSVSPAEGRLGARLSVVDRGPGLDAASLRRVFDRFWRGDDAITAETGGSGLGLAIARELAQGMGAKLKAERRDGGGLVFTLEARA